jgi:hypothetical protein
VVNDAIEDARAICLREYGDAPDVNVYGDPGFAFAYVPSHLHHMVRRLAIMQCYSDVPAPAPVSGLCCHVHVVMAAGCAVSCQCSDGTPGLA